MQRDRRSSNERTRRHRQAVRQSRISTGPARQPSLQASSLHPVHYNAIVALQSKTKPFMLRFSAAANCAAGKAGGGCSEADCTERRGRRGSGS